MNRWNWMLGILLAGAVVAGGCDNGQLEPVRLELGTTAPSADVSDLAAVLAAVVNDKGRLVPEQFAAVRDRLDAQLRIFAVTSPAAAAKLYPTGPQRWAYWYNARTAWSIKLASLAGMSRRIHPQAMDRSFTLGLQAFTLADIDKLLLAEAERTRDFRLAACAPGARVDFGPLPTKPFTAGDFSAQLDRSLSLLVQDEQRLVIDVEHRQVRLGPMLWAARGLVMAEFVRATGTTEAALTTALAGKVNRLARRRLQEALGYTVVAQPPRAQLAAPGETMYFPGKVGRVELPVE